MLLPVDCYCPGAAPGQTDPHNTCRTGSIGVADPRTLQWRSSARTNRAGRARLRITLRRLWRLRARASRGDLRPGFASVRAVRRRR